MQGHPWPVAISILIWTEGKESPMVPLLASFPANSRFQPGLHWGITWEIKALLRPLPPPETHGSVVSLGRQHSKAPGCFGCVAKVKY